MKTTLALSFALLTGCQPINLVNVDAAHARPVSSKPVVPQLASFQTSPHADWKLSVTPGEGGTYQIHVADLSGKKAQVLDGLESNGAPNAEDLLKLDDYTGDGRPDILARGLSVGASALSEEFIYPFDSSTGRFMTPEPFEHSGEISKTTPGCIAIQYRNEDNMTYSKDAYCWEGRWVSHGSKH